MGGTQFAYAAPLPLKNAGFVPANIWYSKDPFFAGDKIRIYTIIFNGSTYDISGGVEFLDNGVVIGKTNFSLSGGGRVQDVWVDWKAGQGAHTITARLVKIVADGPNGKEAALLDNAETGKSDRVVELDPAVVAAEAKAQEQKIAEVKNQAVGKVSEVVSTVKGAIPAPIKENVSQGANALETFRIGEAFQFELSKEKKLKEIGAMNTLPSSTTKKVAGVVDTISNATEKPFAYVMYGAYALLQFIFQYMIVFYAVGLYLVYRIGRWIVWKVRGR